MEDRISRSASLHYDAKYFDWQKCIGEFGGWANANKFSSSISERDVVLDFGCGGGFLLKNLQCKDRIGIEPNSNAADSIKKYGIKHFPTPDAALEILGIETVDVIVSNNALEHTLNPLQELISLRRLLKPGGIIHFVVPCDSFKVRYNPHCINHHLFSWSPQNLGNLFKEAGYDIQYSRPLVHKWPPYYKNLAKLGWPIFNAICRLYGHLERSWFQVEVKARRPMNF